MPLLLRLLLLAPLAYVLALLAAAGIVTLALFSAQIDEHTAAIALGVWIGVTVYGGMISFVPALVAAIAAEALGWRSVLYYLAVGGAIGWLAAETTMAFDGLDFAGQLRLICIAGGFAGGAVYWLIAGKLAGLGGETPRRPTSTA